MHNILRALGHSEPRWRNGGPARTYLADFDPSAGRGHSTPLSLVGFGYGNLPNRTPWQVVFTPHINCEVGEGGVCYLIKILYSGQPREISVKRNNIINARQAPRRRGGLLQNVSRASRHIARQCRPMR